MIYIGLDMSINSPGLCIIDGDQIEFHFRYDLPKRKKIDFPENFFPHPTCNKDQDDIVRYVDNAEWILSCINGRSGRIAIEGYSFGSGGGSNRVFQIAENCAVAKLYLHKAGLQIQTPSPGQIKKWGTGNGAAKKGLMIYKFQEETGYDLYEIFQKESTTSPLSDIADSYFMATWARDCWPET